MLTFSVLLVLTAFGALAQTAPTLSVEGLGKGTVAIDGPWQFHPGDDPSWSTPATNDATGQGGWEQLTADKPWGAQGHRSYAGYAWYRKHLHLTPAPSASQDFCLMIPAIENVYEIYWNGILVGRNGKFPPDPSWPWAQSAQKFNLGPVRDGVLAVRVWKVPLNSFDTGVQGGFYAAPLIGGKAAIEDRATALEYRWLHSRQYFFAIRSLYGLVTLLAFIAWLRNRSERVLLWMSLYCLAPVLNVVLLGLRLPFSFNFAEGWVQPVDSLASVSLWLLLLYLLRLSDNERLVRITRILAYISIVSSCLDGALTALDWSNPRTAAFGQGADGVLTFLVTVPQLLPLALVGFGITRKLDLSRWLVAIFAFLSSFILDLGIAFQQGSRFTHWTFAEKIDAPLFTINGNPITPVAITSAALLLAIVYAVYRCMQETTHRQLAIEQEVRSAQELQQVLIPEELPSLPGFAVTSSYRPAQEVGGDFFQIIPLEGKSAMILVGDVSGKGLRAAMSVSLVVGAVRTLVEATTSPAEVLNGINRRLHGRLRGGFATCVAMRLDADGSCTIANAAHPSPFLNGHEVEFSGSLPLGIEPSTHYSEKVVHLRPSDYMVLYTDGLCEARAATGELFSFERVSDLLAAKPDAVRATEAAVNFGQQDDITVLTLTRLAAGEESRTDLVTPALAPA